MYAEEVYAGLCVGNSMAYQMSRLTFPIHFTDFIDYLHKTDNSHIFLTYFIVKPTNTEPRKVQFLN